MAHSLDSQPDKTYAEIVQDDATGAPEFLAHGHTLDLGTAPMSAERYWCPTFAQKESNYLWNRVWQMACLEDDIPNEGDCFHYEIAERSFIIANTKDGVRAYHNSCLHRGRKLILKNCRKKEFECPFHAITWSLDGKLLRNPMAWDMPQWNEQNSKLPQARVAQWAGFIFICMDESAPAFEDIAAPMIEHFKPYGWDNRYRAWWFEKRVPANWKTTQETFMESHHSQKTHPQLLPSIADINSQYDFMNAYVSRHISAGATASPSLSPQPDELEKIELMQKRGDRRVDGLDLSRLPNDFRARTYLGDHSRKMLGEQSNADLAGAKDSEVLDYLLYAVFPNMSFWAGYGPKLVYRWRPEPGNPEGSIMDVMWMEPVPAGQAKPKASSKTSLDYNDKVSALDFASESLKLVFDQDFQNIPHIQTGMKSLKDGKVNFTNYTEARIRYLHQFIDQFIATGEARQPPPGSTLNT